MVKVKKIMAGDYEISENNVTYRTVINEITKEWHLYAKDKNGDYLGGGWEWSTCFATKKEAVCYFEEYVETVLV